MDDLCEMVDVRAFIIGHDVDGEPIEDYRDVPCENPAAGTHEGDVRVCLKCGRSLEQETFEIVWDQQ